MVIPSTQIMSAVEQPALSLFYGILSSTQGPSAGLGGKAAIRRSGVFFAQPCYFATDNAEWG
jgi:hypothetical protein